MADKLTVRIITAPSIRGNRSLALCDENGEILPNQRDCEVVTCAGELATIRVTFYIDGEDIRFADNDG